MIDFDSLKIPTCDGLLITAARSHAIARSRDEIVFDLFIRAVEIARTSGRGAGVVIAGDGPERQSEEWLAQRCGLLYQVQFVGYADDLTVLLRGASRAAIPLRSEGLRCDSEVTMEVNVLIDATCVGAISSEIQKAHLGIVGKPFSVAHLVNVFVSVLNDSTEARNRACARTAHTQESYSAVCMKIKYLEFNSGLIAVTSPAKHAGSHSR